MSRRPLTEDEKKEITPWAHEQEGRMGKSVSGHRSLMLLKRLGGMRKSVKMSPLLLPAMAKGSIH